MSRTTHSITVYTIPWKEDYNVYSCYVYHSSHFALEIAVDTVGFTYVDNAVKSNK